MNAAKFRQIYNESRNGCNEFFRHPLARRVAYSDGVRDLAETGCYWLLDVLATELPAVMRAYESVASRCIVKVTVVKTKAVIAASFVDDQPPQYTKQVPYTDMPAGVWLFMMADEGEGPTPYRIIMLTEY